MVGHLPQAMFIWIATTHLSQPQRVGQQFIPKGVNAHSHFSQ
jgi:hypothetical protein